MIDDLDTFDRKLLRELRKNGRIANSELAEKIALSPTPCLRRLRRLENASLIEGFTVKLNHHLLGFRVSALAFIKLAKTDGDNAARFEQAAAKFPEVLECAAISGRYDYFLRVISRDLEHYDRFLKQELSALDTVTEIESTIVLKEVFRNLSLQL